MMMDHLNRMISRQVNEEGQVLVLGSFAVNHIASGVFLLLLGAIVSYSSVAGLRSGKKWGRIITLMYGSTLCVLVIVLWMTVPAMFLQAAPFRWALTILTAVAILAIAPMILFRQHFNEP